MSDAEKALEQDLTLVHSEVCCCHSPDAVCIACTGIRDFLRLDVKAVIAAEQERIIAIIASKPWENRNDCIEGIRARGGRREET